MTGDEVTRIEVLPAEAGLRLDRVLAERLELSRSRLKALIEDGRVRIDDLVVTAPATRVRQAQRLTVSVPPPEPDRPVALAMALDIRFEDEDLVVLEKPAGLVVHPAPGHADDTLVNALLAHCGESLAGIGGVRRPGIVHRLDKETSGLMVVAKSDLAHAALTRAFAERDIERAYQAVVWGVPEPRLGRVDAPIGRSPVNRKKMAVVGNGRQAITNYAVIRPLGLHASLVECRLETGRTHQIRVHMTHIGHGLIGDPVYGRAPARVRAASDDPRIDAARNFDRQALHAGLLGFTHPRDRRAMRFESCIPADLAALIRALEASLTVG